MLQLKLEVNGCLIDFVNIVNRSKQLPNSKSVYEVTYKGKQFGFTHIRTEGAVVCALKALQAIIDENPAMSEQRIIDLILDKGNEEQEQEKTIETVDDILIATLGAKEKQND